MDRKNFFAPLAAICAAILMQGCATSVDSPVNEAEKRYFDAWVAVNIPDWTKTEHWIYIDEAGETVGTGDPVAEGYLFVEYTVRDLNGNITSSTSEETAKRLNTYKPQNYYGPKVWNTSSMNAGVYYAVFDLGGMKIGGKRTAVIPGWMASYTKYSTEEEYINNVTGNSDSIYEIELTGSSYDIEKLDTDTTSTLFASDTTVYINYTGMLLNGQAFDTTKERTAKDNNIYSSSKTYEPVKITWSENWSGIKMGDDGNSVKSGFAKTLWRMSCVEGVKSATGMFYSGFGYSYSGSGDVIPAYAPLIFEIEFTEAPED